jgi:hypothetical protein
LIEDEADLQRYTSKKVSKKVPKKSTVQETYELWVEKNSIADIATIRVHKTNYLRAFCSTDTVCLLLRFYLRIKYRLAQAFKGYRGIAQCLNGEK